ncbi:MAG: hypothetical protein GXP42_10975 [Chloroflexi bacterium]|nr:hypothetical protein [Chloroflexota bacterium]
MATDTMAPDGGMIPWWVVLLEGIAAIIIGVLLLTSPGVTMFALVTFLGVYWLITGIFAIVSIFIDNTSWGWKLFSGVIGIMAGLLILQHPLISTIIVPATGVWVMGIFGVVIGVINLIQAFQGGGWGIGVLGVLSILFGAVLMANPLIGAAALPFVLGSFGLVFGIFALVAAFKLKP